MKTGKLFLSSLFVLAFFIACGDDVTRVVSPSGLETVSLGECSSETLGKMLYVAERKSAYVCGDTGWFPLASHREKLACDFESLEDSSGYRMVCDGDSVGVIYHGKDGADGTLGANGEDGSLASCSIIEKENWIFLQVCGSDTTFLYQAICGGEPFDPKMNFCFENKAFEKTVFGTVTDLRDSEVYRTVRIGKQTWMAEDLRLDIPLSLTNNPKACYTTDTSAFCALLKDDWNTGTSFAAYFNRVFADSAAESILSLGRLYEAESLSVSDRAGLCPDGFHLPDSSEWNELLAFVKAQGQGVEPMIALGANYGWSGCSGGNWDCGMLTGFGNTSEGQNRGTNGVDLFGFSALPVWNLVEKPTMGGLSPEASVYMYGNLSAYITDEGLFTMLAADGAFHYRNISVGDVPCLSCVTGRHAKIIRGFVRCVGD